MDRTGAQRVLGNVVPQQLAQQLEEAVFARDLRIPDYRARIRHLAYNLRANAALVQCTPQKLAHMTPEQMKVVVEEAPAAAGGSVAAEPPPSSGMLQCKKCKSWDTEWTTMQTRGADEAATIFARCNNCKRNWKPSNG